jgi:glycosyltransferase involved in cell wall biosynthesis
MKLSIFTPSHNPKFLDRAWESILTQGYNDFEWVIVLNNGAQYIRPNSSNKVKIVYAPEWSNNSVGALKRLACENCTGDVFVELDHDDILLPGCLNTIASSLAGKENAFFYSATDELKDGKPVLYGPDFGWLRGTNKEGVPYNIPFEVSPRSICEIYWAPNHVKAWTREAYRKSGGHDPRLEVCDDQDIMIKTYLGGSEFIKCDDTLYRQYITSESTQKKRNADIQNMCAQLKTKYLHTLVKEWCNRKNLAMLDLGGAHNSPKGYTPVDMVKVPGGIEHDIANKGIPFADNTVGAIRANDFMEHVPIGKVVPLMNDIYRSLAPGGWLLCNTPSSDGRGAFCDPTHVSFWNELSMRYYCNRNFSKYVPEIKCRFQAVRNQTYFPSEWHKTNNVPYIASDLCALKGQRQPGSCEI